LKLKIVSLGYFGHLNAGDDLLRESISQLFSDHDILFTSWFPGIDLINSADLLLVGGGSIWPGHTVFQHAVQLSKRLRIPLFVLGISAKTDANIKMKQANYKVTEYSNLFLVRDKASFDIFERNPKVSLGTDLFWWSNHCSDDIKPISYNHKVALNLRSWDTKWSPKRIVSIIESKGVKISPWPFYYGSRIHEAGDNPTDVELLSKLLGKTPSSFSLMPIESSSFSICMRFHGILLSVRSKRPVIGFNYHKKTEAFFKENDITELCVGLNDEQALSNAISLLQNNFDTYLLKFERIRHNLLLQGESDKTILNKKLELIKPNKTSHFQRLKNLVKKIPGIIQ